VLVLESVSKVFGARKVLDGVSLQVGAGEYVAILGESGIGKSTLLNVIAGLEPVDAGSITFQGARLAGMDDDALTLLRREKLGFVFQAFHVLPQLSVEQNVALPLLLRKLPREPAVAEILRAVGLAGRESSMPRELSGGELQRVAIARALVGDPKVVFADEPTGNLDTRNGEEVMALLDELNTTAGVAIVLVTHEADIAAHARRQIQIRDGVIAYDSAAHAAPAPEGAPEGAP
jgi:putative ABC transport system ATP-binding protein